MIDVRRAWLVAALVTLTAAVAAQQPQQPGQPASPPAAPPAVPPTATAPLLPGTVACPAPAPPAIPPDRSFIAPAGMMLVQVIPTKVAEFEKFLGYVRDALAKTTDATLRAQAKGWKFFRVAELGPNKDVLYAFVIDPAVTCVDYGFGQLLQVAIADDAKLQEVWELYRTSVRPGNGGALMNFVPLPLGATATTTPAPAPGAQKPANSAPPLDANPTRPPQ